MLLSSVANMEKGQIVRRMLNDGTPVGPYMRIVRFTHTHAVTQRIAPYDPDKESDELYITKNHIYVVKTFKLIISNVIWERINNHRQNSIIHDICPTWNRMNDKEPEVVQIRAFNYPTKVMLFGVDQIVNVWYNRERQLRLDLGERIL